MVWYNNVANTTYLFCNSEEFQLMGIFEIISAIVLILACVFIVIVVLMKDTKTGQLLSEERRQNKGSYA